MIVTERNFNLGTDKERPNHLDEEVLRYLKVSPKPLSSQMLGILCNRKISDVKKCLTKLKNQGRVKKATSAQVCFWKLSEPKTEQIKDFHRPAREV